MSETEWEMFYQITAEEWERFYHLELGKIQANEVMREAQRLHKERVVEP